MKSGKHPSRYSSGEHFAAVHEDVITSEAYRWIPHFAKAVLFAIAGRYRGFNNGGLELTVALAQARGLNKSELYAGLRLCMHAGLIKQTSKGKYRSGKGIPAKYALTWRPLNAFPALNLTESDRPGDEWARFKSTSGPIRSLSQAEIFLGIRKPRKRTEPKWPLQDSKEASGPVQTKTQLKSVPPQTKPRNESEPSHTSVCVPPHTKKNSNNPRSEAQIG